jgi:hypothetical protein
MSDAPPQQPPVNNCEECDQQKKTATREVAFSSTTKDSKTKHRQGTGEFGPLSGDLDRRNSETTSTGSTVKRTENFFICPTPGCSQRTSDRWDARRWELKNDPTLNDSPESQDKEIERIIDEEKEHRKQKERISNRMNSKDWNTDMKEGIKRREQESQRYHNGQSESETKSSRQSTHHSTHQSGDRSRDSDDRSRRSEEQTNATGWGSDTSTRSEDQATAAATGWGADDAPRSNGHSTEQRDDFAAALDMTGAETTAQGNEAFEQNVNANESEATNQNREDLHESLDPEAVDEEHSETVDRSRNTSHSRSRRRR